MMKGFIILFFSFYIFNAAAQIKISPLEYDYSRNPHSNHFPAARISSSHHDTINLPFFEDFAATNASIDSVLFTDTIITITTLGNHGLKDRDLIYLFFQDTIATSLNGNHYVKVTSKTAFNLYADFGLEFPNVSSISPTKRLYGYWRRPNAKRGPNPDTTKWVHGGGVYVNNTLGFNPPSIYFASFDGLDERGNPYEKSSGNSGPIDHLTSLPLNLSGLDSNSKLVLSFYWQPGGQGFFPDNKDSLYLAVKDTAGNWIRLWGKKGGGYVFDSTKFYYEEIEIKNPAFIYNGFQFKFQAVGSRGGSNENWNIDYVYFDKFWNDTKKFPRDRAISQSQTSILKNYTSVPADHFFMNPASYLNDSISLQLKNLSNDFALLQFRDNYLTDGKTKMPFDVPISTSIVSSRDTNNYSWKVDKENFPSNSSFLNIKYVVTAFTSDPDKFNGIDFTPNNTDSTEVILDNYYAYDDGSAEMMGSNANGGPFIMAFNIPKVPDTLTHIDVFIPKTSRSEEEYRKTIKLLCYNNEKKSIQNIPLKFIDYNKAELNAFNRFEVDTIHGGIPITTDTFYIGYQNPLPSSGIQRELPIGIDNNSKVIPLSFSRETASQPWKQYVIPGNFMFRPVFGVNTVVGLPRKNAPTLKCEVYPNPSRGRITLHGQIEHGILFDISGKKLWEQSITEENSDFDFSDLSDGLYYLHLSNSKGLTAVKKLSILK